MQPTTDLPLIPSRHATTLEHLGEIHSAAFMPDGETVLVHLHTRVIDLWALAVHYWPEIGAAVVTLALAALLWRIARVRSRPELAGRPHCRTCRFNLTAHTDASGSPRTDAPCPECGRPLTPRAIIRGRSSRRRLAAPAAAFTLLAGLYAAGWIAQLPRSNAASTWFFFPSTRLAEWISENQSERLLPFVTAADRFVRVDARTGDVTHRYGVYRSTSWLGIRVTEDGRSGIRVVRDGRRSGVVQLIDLATRSVTSEAVLPFDDPMSYVALRNESAVIATIDNVRAVLIAGRTGDRHQILRWTPRTGDLDEILHATAIEPIGTWQAAPDRFNNPKLLATVNSFLERMKTSEAVIRFFRLSDPAVEAARYALPTKGSIGSLAVSARGRPVVSQDGNRLFVASRDVRASIVTLNAATGAADQIGEPPDDLGPGNHMSVGDSVALAANGSTAAITAYGNAGIIGAVRSIQDAEWTALLSHDGDLLSRSITLSRDGSWAFSIGFFESANQGPHSHLGKYTNELVFHDLTRLNTPDQPAPTDR